MKKGVLVILALSLILATVFTLLITSPSPVGAGGIVVNQGFESALGGEWVVDGSAGRTNTTPIHDGSYAAQITAANGTLTQFVDVFPFARYECWGWIYATENVTGRIEFSFIDANATVIITDVLYASDTNGYELKKVMRRAPVNADYLRIRLTARGWVTGEDVRFDDIGVSLPSEGCFIATAAYGTPLAEEIEVLRQFRDQYLVTNPAGRLLVSLYYQSSPPLAHIVSEHEGLKAVTRMALEPIIWLCSRITTTPGP